MNPKKGVYEAKRKDGTLYYRSSITFKNKHISLGSFSNHSDAHEAYQYATTILNNPSISLAMYDASTSPITFQKFVSLVNYRDHLLYFKNPIYLRNRYFEYYLSNDIILKFDIDDLFYYSTHQIMKRGNHLFVADYGMQTSILFRYSIHPFSVKGIDYTFINGDPYDFRYSNIKVINPYIGVRKCIRNATTLYQARINLKGTYIIGYYDTLNEAAIAYNKAADYLNQSGIKKEYQKNYISELNLEDYQSLYRKITISNTLKNLVSK